MFLSLFWNLWTLFLSKSVTRSLSLRHNNFLLFLLLALRMAAGIIILNGGLSLDILLDNFSQSLFDEWIVVLYPGGQIDVLLELSGDVLMLGFVQELCNQEEYFFEER